MFCFLNTVLVFMHIRISRNEPTHCYLMLHRRARTCQRSARVQRSLGMRRLRLGGRRGYRRSGRRRSTLTVNAVFVGVMRYWGRYIFLVSSMVGSRVALPRIARSDERRSVAFLHVQPSSSPNHLKPFNPSRSLDHQISANVTHPSLVNKEEKLDTFTYTRKQHRHTKPKTISHIVLHYALLVPRLVLLFRSYFSTAVCVGPSYFYHVSLSFLPRSCTIRHSL